MKVVILAGGYGTRLGKLTKHTPKPLMKIGEKTILQHIVDRLYKHGLTEIIIKTHYLPEQIMEGIGDKALYYYEPVLFDAQESLKNLSNWLAGEDFMVINGDTISEVDFTRMLNTHLPRTITAFMDADRCAGVWIYPEEYFEAEEPWPIIPYRPHVAWFDCGTPERLQAAKEHFEQGVKNVCP